MKKKDIDFIFQTLDKLYPNADTELKFWNNFQLVLAVVMSAQTTDKQVNKVTEKLFKQIKTPQDVIKMWLENLTKSISSVNYYNNKAKHIYELSKMLNKEPWLLCPDLEKLQKLPWVWIKTAKVISYVLFWSKVIAVDTHVHRVANRLWLVDTKSPEKTSQELEKIVPDKYKKTAHHTLILFGRYHCTARNPKCNECQLANICKYKKSL